VPPQQASLPDPGLRAEMKKHLRQALDDPAEVFFTLLKLPLQLNELFRLLFEPQASLRDFRVIIEQSPGLNADLKRLFTQLPSPNNDTKGSAHWSLSEMLSYLGLTRLRQWLPMLMFSARANITCPNMPLVGYKLCRYGMTVSSTCRQLLKVSGYDQGREREGDLLGLLSGLGMLAVYRQFCLSFSACQAQRLLQWVCPIPDLNR